MNSTQSTFGQPSSGEMSGTAYQIGSDAWAAFFIWVGIAMLANLPWGD